MSPPPVTPNNNGTATIQSPVDGISTTKPVSRDPRLAAREPQGGRQDVEKMLRGLLSSNMSMVTLDAERRRISKRIQREDEVKRKADQRQFQQFPSFQARQEGLRNTLDGELRQVDQKLQEQKKIQDQVIQSLSTILSAAAEFTAQTDRLRADMNTAKADTGRLERVAQLVVTKAEHAEKSLNSVSERVQSLETKHGLFANLVDQAVSKSERAGTGLTSLSERFKGLDAKHTLLAESVEQAVTKADRADASITSLSKQVEGIDSKHTLDESVENLALTRPSRADFQAISERVRGLDEKHSRLAESVEELAIARPSKTQFEEALHNVDEKLRSKHEEFSRQLDTIRSSAAQRPQSPQQQPLQLQPPRSPQPHQQSPDPTSIDTLRSDLQNLFTQFESLRATQAACDQEVVAELSQAASSIAHLKESVEGHARDLGALRSGLADVQHTQREIPQVIDTALQPYTVRLNKGLGDLDTELRRQFSEMNKPLATAVYSLQERFNRTTTEPIVTQMVASMQRIYPNVAAAQKEYENVQRELASFKERVALLEGRITSAEKAQSEAKTEREESIKEMSAERDRVFRVIESQKAAINAIGATVEKLTLLQAANAERDRAIRDLEARIAKIKELEDQGKATLEQIASLQAMNTERDQVAHEIEAQGVKLNDMEDRWKSTVKNLDSILTDLNSISKSLASEKVLTHQRLGDVEGTVSDRLAQLVVDVEETGKRMDTFEKKTNELSAAVNILYARSRSSDSSGEGSVAGSADGSQRMGTPSSVSQGLHFNPPRAPASMNGGSLKMGPYSTESPTSSTHRATKKRKFKSNLSPRPSAAEEGVKHGC